MVQLPELNSIHCVFAGPSAVALHGLVYDFRRRAHHEGISLGVALFELCRRKLAALAETFPSHISHGRLQCQRQAALRWLGEEPAVACPHTRRLCAADGRYFCPWLARTYRILSWAPENVMVHL